MVYNQSEISYVLVLSQAIGIGLTGLFVEKVTDGDLRFFDHCQTGIYNGYSLQLTLIIATSSLLILLVT